MRHRLIWLAIAAAVPAPALAQTAPAKGKPPTVGEVVVTGQAPAVRTSIDRKSYSVAGDLQAQTGSIGDALRNVPSVEVDVQGNVALRGDQNVTILIDGKPSAMFRGEGKGQALQALPADRIDRVEVITNPSAEFSADGTAGVINLVTKKAKGAGRTGSARITAGTGDRIFGSGALGYNGPALSVTADAFLRLDTLDYTDALTRSQFTPAQAGFVGTEQDLNGHNDVHLLGGRVGVDYDLDAHTRLSGELSGQLFDFESDEVSRTIRQDPAGALIQDFDRGVRVDQSRENLEVSTTLLRKFADDGHQLTLNASYEDINYDRTRQGVNVNRLPASPASYDRQVVFSDFQQVQVKGDYVRPFEGGAKLKAGFDIQWDDNTYDNLGFSGPSGSAATPDPSLTNLFKFQQQLAQAYVTYEQPFGDLTVLAGLRYEDGRIDLNQVTQADKTDNDHARAYPSLHLSWKVSDTSQLTASYSERVQRPMGDAYNSFRFLIDPLTYRSGNARLKPQETQSFELGYQYRKAGTVYLATLYYRENEKVISDVTRQLEGGALLITRANVSETRNAGLELVANGRLGKTLSYNVSGNLYWNELDPTALGVDDKRSGVTAFGRASVNWQVTPNDLVQLSGFLNAKRLTAQGYVEPTGMLNMGYRHKFNDRLSGIVTVQDLLSTFETREVVDTPLLKTRLRREIDSRFVMVGVIWTLGGGSGRQRDPGFDFNPGGGPPST